MIQRRQFIVMGSVAAGYLIGVGPSRIWADDLNWRCSPIQTLTHSQNDRAPVVTGVCLSPDESMIAVVGDDHLVSILDVVTKKFVRTLSAHRDWVRSVAFSPDGTQLATVGNDRFVFLWNTTTWADPFMLAQQPQAVTEVAYSPVAQQLATVGFSNTLYIYDVATKQEIFQLKCPCEDNRAVAFSKDGRHVAAGGRCGRIRVWDSATGTVAAEYQAHRQRIRSIQFTAAGKVLSCGDDQAVRLSDPLGTNEMIELPSQSAKLYHVSLLDDDTCATAGSDNQIAIWKLSTREQLGVLKGHTGTVSCLSSSPKLLISGSYDTQIRIWHRQVDTVLKQERQTNFDPGWNSRIK